MFSKFIAQWSGTEIRNYSFRKYLMSLIVVSGGTKGIGRAIIEKFMSQGFDAVTCARSPKDLNKMKSELMAAHPNASLYTFQGDMSKKEEVEDFVQFISGISGNVDVLVNNTGIFIPGQVLEEPDGTLEKMIETNVYSAYYLSRGLAPAMKGRKKGHIFNICSIASITAYASGGSYAISKFAMYGMSKVLREELKPEGVRVTAVLPGATFTSSWEGVDLPRDRFIPVGDVASMVWAAYSLSPRSVVEDIVIRPQLGDI